MKFVSTRGTRNLVSLDDAVMQGLAADGGLFLPESIPVLPEHWWLSLAGKDDHTIAAELLHPYLEEVFFYEETLDICQRSLNFPVPLHQLDSETSILELFHGPTLAFKDVGARFLAHVMENLLARRDEYVTILTATSGDTGSAVAQAFHGSERVRVVVLYPSGKISRIQEKQMTTLGGNISALEVRGNFDDCQRMAKEAFNNAEMRSQFGLTSANSINIMRLLPQMIYYVLAWRDAGRPEEPPVFSVPSGNFGNLTAGLIAHRMGMPVKKFLAACNANHVFPDFLKTDRYQPHPSIETLSNAMDVGNPSNFERMQFLMGESAESFQKIILSNSYDDEATTAMISEIYQKHHYLADPHTAIGLLAWQEYKTRLESSHGIVLSTAHPVKFGDAVRQAAGIEPDIPDRLAKHLQADKKSHQIANDSRELFTWLGERG